MNLKEVVLNTVLKDDETSTGGTSHSRETLEEFMEVAEIPQTYLLGLINIRLKESGIKPINPFNYPELFQFGYVDLQQYISNHYQYLDCFSYIAKENDWEKEVSFIEDIIRENLEKNVIESPYEFKSIYNSDKGLEWTYQYAI